ncbi:MAG: hypothetical protein NC293_13990, partial [Roseburia sp.]|nr:hypothetical protein [Roseburia sp.]
PDGTYYIYDLRLTPRPQGDLPNYTFTTVPMSESFEGDTTALLGLDSSTIVASGAQDGSKCMEVAATDAPTLLIDNREGTSDLKYKATVYVKAKDTADAGIVKFAGSTTFKDAKYETYQGYENVKGATCTSNERNLSNSGEWMTVTANITVSAGSISEVSLTRVGNAEFAYLMDSFVVTER